MNGQLDAIHLQGADFLVLRQFFSEFFKLHQLFKVFHGQLEVGVIRQDFVEGIHGLRQLDAEHVCRVRTADLDPQPGRLHGRQTLTEQQPVDGEGYQRVPLRRAELILNVGVLQGNELAIGKQGRIRDQRTGEQVGFRHAYFLCPR